MKKSTFSKIAFIALLLLMGLETYAQNFVDFTPKFNQTLKGDIRLIGNNILGPHKTNPYNGGNYNHLENMIYVDIDNDNSTFNSSSADLEIPNDGCYRIVHAGLYWGAVNRGSESLTDVKFKGPEGPYINIKGTVIYDAKTKETGSSFPYASYADVTSIVAGLGTNLGTYTVANVSTGQGKTSTYKPTNGTGHSAGWSLFIVFEDPTLPGKYITSFDGFSSINKTNNIDVPISGFQTPPSPIPVTAKFAFAALEGDEPISGDRLKINGWTMSTPDRPQNNFFNSKVTKLGGGLVNNRNPNSRNTLGFDTGIMDVPNPDKKVIGNGDTSAIIRMESSQDQYFAYFFAFAVDVIQPKIVLTKIVLDADDNEIGGAVVDLGQKLTYVIGFQNKGNDDAQNMVIRDSLPTNINFNYPADLVYLPPSVESHTYDPAKKVLTFKIKNDYLKKGNSPLSEIRIGVQVVESCNQLSDMCSNIIQNQAFTTYYGVENPSFKSTDDPSVDSNSFCLLVPQSTNFLADLSDCIFTQNATLCTDSVKLTAANGYNKYKWSTDIEGNNVIGTEQTITISKVGTYYVHNTAVAPCQNIDQIFTVTNFVGATLINPIIAFADVSSECTNDGELLPKIFLCGKEDFKLIDTKITDTSSIIWEKLVENSCTTTSGSDDCANTDGSCKWNQVGTGPIFNAKDAGEYRLTLNYEGGCFNQYYFNVYKNELNPTAKVSDIFCNTEGKITVGGVPSGYEYSIGGKYQSSNVFNIPVTGAGTYTVSIRQVGITTNPCIFTVPDVVIRKREFNVVSKVEQPRCNGDKGSIRVEAQDVRPQYTFTLSIKNGSQVNSSGLSDKNFYKFSDLNEGIYIIHVKTTDGCEFSEEVKIIDPPKLTATSKVSSPITCNEGEITITANGGTPPYFYFVNGSEEFVEFDGNEAKFKVTEPGTYEFKVVDYKDCSAFTKTAITALPAPVYTLSHSDILCYNTNTGEIKFDVTNANGYNITYSINNGTDYFANPIFADLAAGTYAAKIKYSINEIECFSEANPIIIKQVDTALTASAGVSELAGCGPSGEGKVRITNPQGGTPPYQYSFDNQSSWVSSNEAYVTPGTYTLYIKDANNCIYQMPKVVLDPEPVAPIINVSEPDFNCDGTANATVTITNSETDSFSYTYLLDGVENTNTADPKVFLNVPDGDHIVTVRYNLQTVPTYSNLLYETFGYGEDTTSPGINTDYYCFERQVEATKCNGNIAINDGDYSVTARVVSPFSTWLQPGDHTPQTVPPTPKGRSLVVNIGDKIPVTAVLYQKEINDIIPNQPINVEFFAMNLIKSTSNIYDPNLLVALVDANGIEISSFSTGNIPKSEKWENYPKTPMTLNPGANTSLKFIVRSNVRQVNGNDVAIDDIKVYQLPKICVTEVEFPFIVATEKAFTAKVSNTSDATCFGTDDGTITISAQNFDTTKGFQYSVTDGTWVTAMTSPATIEGLGAGTYNIKVRYENTDDTCFVLLNQEIDTPSIIVVTAEGTPVTCLTGGTITVSATGGSGAYSYELLYTASSIPFKNFPKNGVLIDIPAGDYTIRATDGNKCAATATLILTEPTLPTASLIVTNQCYDPKKGATIEVTAQDGQTPYQYKITGGDFSKKNKFTGLTPGSYIITVKDHYGCEVTLDAVVIADQLVINTKLDKDLDCSVSSNAIIKGTFSGGYAPFTYEVSRNGGAYSNLGALTGTSFTYSTADAGNYRFRITDEKGCTVISEISKIDAIESPSATTTVENAKCNGNNNGSFQIIPSGGVGPYTYSFNGSQQFTSKSHYTGLAAGTYDYQVKDAKQCVFDGKVTITEPSVLEVTASATSLSCSVDNTAEAAVVTIAVPTTGTAPYTYSFNGSEYTATNTLTVNDNGATQTINYSVKDFNGCTKGNSITISRLNGPTDLTFTASKITCTATTSTVTLTAVNGVGALQYETIAPSPQIISKQGANTFTGLTSGTYLFKVTDANGCYYTESLTIAPVTNIAVAGDKLSDALCYGDANGKVVFTASGYAGGYTAVLTSGTGTLTQTVDKINLTNLAAGSYTVQVTDLITGCTATDTVVISQPDNALDLSASGANVHCNNYESQITAIAIGGTPNYKFAAVLTGSPAPNDTAYKANNTIVVNTNTGTRLIWDVYVKDANGCTDFKTVTIILDAKPTVKAPKVDNQCTANSGFTFTAVGTGVEPLQYSINGGASYQDNGTFTVNAAGSYIIRVKDANGCTADSPTATQVFAPITVSATLNQDISCFATPDASINISASGGNAPYTYEVRMNGGAYTSITGPVYTTVIAGTYQFRVTDASTCPKETEIITVNPAINPEITAVVVAQDINCNGDETGALTITIDPTLGLAPFVINVYNDSTLKDYGTQTSGLAAGDYTITVTDAKGCTDTETITISEPRPIVVAHHAVPIKCDESIPGGGVSKGSVIIDSVTGGTAPYNYFVTGTNGYAEEELNNAGTTSIEFNVVDFGMYQINVVDKNGCSVLIQNVLVASPPDDLKIVIEPTVDCTTGGEATVSVAPLEGVGPFYFSIYPAVGIAPGGSWLPGDAATPRSVKFNNLTPGVIYTFIVFDKGSGCSYFQQSEYAIPTNSTLTADAVTANNIKCKGSADGNVGFTITNIYGVDVNVSYQIYDSFTLDPISGTNATGVVPANGTLDVIDLGPLDFGNYYVLIEETSGPNTGCGVVTIPFNITESSIDLSITAKVSKNENCKTLGIISATGSFGTGPYTYQAVITGATPDPSAWNTTNTFNLPAKTYDVYVKDAYGCEKLDTVTLIKDDEPTIETVDQVCFVGDPFNITLTGTTFNGNATYSIGGAFTKSPAFTITAAGTYTLTLKDDNGCTATTSLIVEPPLLLDATLMLDLTCDLDASIKLTASGGTGTYSTYEVSKDGGTYVAIGTLPYEAIEEGSFIFRVTDSQGCTALSNTIVVTPKTTPTVAISTQINASCNGVSDGSLIVTAADGIAPYQYSIDGGIFQTSNLFEGLAAGLHTIIVKDSKNCVSAPINATITQPDVVDGTGDVTISLSCGVENATQAATVTITGLGGTPPYTYSFDGINFTSVNTYKTFVAGTVTAYVKDANNCAVSGPINVEVLPLSVPTDLDFEATAVTCINTTSEVTLTATGGIGTLTYEIIAPASATTNTTGAATGIFTGLAPATYTFTVTDANGCYYTESHTVIPVINITVSGSVVKDVACLGESNGEIKFEVAKYAGTYSYQINGGALVSGQNSPTISSAGLLAGDYTIVVTDDTTGCIATYTVTVNEPTAVALIENSNVNAYCDLGAVVNVQASGGTAPYQYAFVVDGSSPVASDYTDSNTVILDPTMGADWDAWVMDSNGCTTKIDIVIVKDPLPTIDVPAIAANQCAVANGFEFTVTNPTGIAPFTYSIGNGFQSNPTFTVATSGTYTVTIKDAHGCTNAVPVTIEIYPALALTPTITSSVSCADDDGVITVTTVGGSGTYTYSINSSAPTITSTGNVFSGVPSGSYIITIADTVTGCTETADITLDAATAVDFTLTPTDVSCNGGNDGTISVELTIGNDDNPVYTYEIIAGPITKPLQNSNVFVGLVAGTYTVQVNSGRGCIATDVVVVGEPDPIVVSAPIVIDYLCTTGTNSMNLATISVNTVIGGSGNYTRYEFIKGTTVVQAGTKNVYTETDLAGGSYTINVYDNNGCLGTTTATIRPFISLEALNVTIDTAITCTNDESITVSATSIGGVLTNLEFVLEPYTTGMPTQVNGTGIFTGLSVGNYKITVTNVDTGCSLQTIHYVNNPNTFDLSIDSFIEVTCFSAKDGSVNVTFIDRVPTPTNDAGPFSYTVVDALGASVASGTTANAGPITITGLASGIYTISASLTNSPFCTVDKNFTITGPTAALEVFETHTEITCVSGNNDGTIFATAKGGWPGGYEFELSGNTIATIPYSTNAYFKNLSAGVYTVSARDSRGCIVTEIIELTNPLPIIVTASADATMLNCYGDENATITVALPTGGQGSNYSYTLNTITPVVASSGPQLSPVFTGLGAGTYSITVTDGYNCSATTVTILIAEPDEIKADLVTAKTATCLIDATLTLSAKGGTGSYEYSASSTFASILGSFAKEITFSVPVGNYKYYVRDANGCLANVSNSIKIDPVPALVLNLDVTNAAIKCFGENTGVIVANAQGGLGSYVYTLQDAAGNPIPAIQSTPGVFTELYAGEYYVHVDSGDCDTTSGRIEITQPTSSLDVTYDVFDVTCFGGKNGSIVINATGGTGLITYAISPQLNQFFTKNLFEDLKPGDYTVVVNDANGCYEIIEFTISEPTPVTISLVPNSKSPEICYGDNDAAFSITLAGGTGPYSVRLDDPDGAFTQGAAGQIEFDFTGLAGGDHIVYVRDAEGCQYEALIELDDSVKILPTVSVVYDCVNNTSENVVTVSVDSSITDLSQLDYSLNGGPYQSSNVFTDVMFGEANYITVRHTNTCEQTTDLFTIDQIDQLTLVIADGGLNEIVATATGGTRGYTYTFNGESTGSKNTYIITESGDYTVTVTDSSGCIASATRYFEFVDICIPNYFTPNGDNNLDTWAPGCAVNYPNLIFKIFDRYGREVGSYRQGGAWDGKYNGRELPSGDYWYVVKLNGNDDRDFVGHFTLYR